MRRFSLFIVKGFLFIIAVVVLSVIAWSVSFGLFGMHNENGYWKTIIFFIIFFTSISKIIALYAVFKCFIVIRYLEKRTKQASYLKPLHDLNRSGLFYSISLIMSLPFVYLFVEKEDAPGLLLIYLIAIGIGFFAWALSYLLEDQLSDK